MTRHGWTVLSLPGTRKLASSGLFQYFADSARVGCTVPSSSVQRDMIVHSLPSHFQFKPNRVCAMRYTGDCSSVACHVWPPSVEMSTLRTAPAPDHARPVM